MTKLTCKCGKNWDYRGQNKHKATCPDCRASVRIAVIPIIVILVISGFGLAYADEIDLPLDEPFDDLYCTFLAASDHVNFTCTWKWFLPEEIIVELDPYDIPARISDLPQHNIELADKISLLLEEYEEPKDQMDLDFEEFLHPDEPLTFEERQIEASIDKLDQCLRGLGAWKAYQTQTEIPYFVDESRYSFGIRDNLSQNIHLKRILLAIEECDIMRTYERMNLIGAYELNKVLADIAGLDYLGRTAEHPLATDVTDQSQEGMVHTDPVTDRDKIQAIEEAERYLREQAPWIDPTLGCIPTEDDPDRCLNRGSQPAGLKCQTVGQPSPIGVYAERVCPLDDYNAYILSNPTITPESIQNLLCVHYFGIYEHKVTGNGEEFPAWLSHCIPEVDEE